jgi:hypothetical protein
VGATSGQGPAGGGCGGGGRHELGAGGREVVGWGTEAEFRESPFAGGGGGDA